MECILSRKIAKFQKLRDEVKHRLREQPNNSELKALDHLMDHQYRELSQKLVFMLRLPANDANALGCLRSNFLYKCIQDKVIPDVEEDNHQTPPPAGMTKIVDIKEAFDKIMNGEELFFTRNSYLDPTFTGKYMFSRPVMELFVQLHGELVKSDNADVVEFVRNFYHSFLKFFNDQYDVDWQSEMEVIMYYHSLRTLTEIYELKFVPIEFSSEEWEAFTNKWRRDVVERPNQLYVTMANDFATGGIQMLPIQQQYPVDQAE